MFFDKSEPILHICQMWIEREITSVLKRLASERPAILVTGARQTGKSSLLKRLFDDYHYVSLDVPLDARQASENGQAFLSHHGTPLLIDEIQYAPELFRYLKIEIDKNRNTTGQYIMTGSQKYSLMKGLSESLAGRISIINLHSLSIRELIQHFNIELDSEQTLQWLVKGGYPEIYEKDLNVHRFYGDYVATYIERDVRQLLNIRYIREFDQFMRLMAIRSGQQFSMSRIATEVGMSTHTIKSWLSVLEASNIIYLLKPYYQNFGKRIVKSPKLYFLDTGLLCYLANVTSLESLLHSPLLGAYFETLAFNQLLRQTQCQDKIEDIYYYRDKDGLEADFVIPEAGQLNLYECKWNDLSGGST